MYEYEIKQVIKVIDGDTVDVMFDVGFSMFRKERVRLNRIDAPQMAAKDPREKQLALDAKEFVAKWLGAQKTLRGRTTKDDKYGRILTDIYGDGDESLNEQMVRLGYAWEYDGGTKRNDFTSLIERREATSTETKSN